MLQECPPPKADTAILASFAAIGLGLGQPMGFTALDSDTRRGLERA
ncbi:hypothetical protein PS726_01825 [Pseudomonas fluorescens]|nr:MULTISPECIES: hypothetical protein [Pseudomonas]PBJ07709.1 hypothetical protein BSF40_19040 [Pseudomonas sp. ACN5]VVM61259.1 hypothetical protein PS647_01310 [Pseudomonas fluorescens]VVN90324.1 hypothetical protein PS726_01825 [Pseudomonas fluorescens]VVO55769.1 hypothetical protein PS843_00518 [Pseudomonas fluorescens]